MKRLILLVTLIIPSPMALGQGVAIGGTAGFNFSDPGKLDEIPCADPTSPFPCYDGSGHVQAGGMIQLGAGYFSVRQAVIWLQAGPVTGDQAFLELDVGDFEGPSGSDYISTYLSFQTDFLFRPLKLEKGRCDAYQNTPWGPRPITVKCIKHIVIPYAIIGIDTNYRIRDSEILNELAREEFEVDANKIVFAPSVGAGVQFNIPGTILTSLILEGKYGIGRTSEVEEGVINWLGSDSETSIAIRIGLLVNL